METCKKNWFKYIAGFIVCILIRLIPFRPPNIEPVLATQMPFSRAYGAALGFLFAFLNIVLIDLITGKVGQWTLVVGTTYGILGIGAYYFFKKFKGTKFSYAGFAIIGTLFFDAVTGLSIGPLFFGQSFSDAFVGQIPFTLWHLLGNVSFALVLSPAIYHYVINNKNLETMNLINIFKTKTV